MRDVTYVSAKFKVQKHGQFAPNTPSGHTQTITSATASQQASPYDHHTLLIATPAHTLAIYPHAPPGGATAAHAGYHGSSSLTAVAHSG